jgi:hypothetical protein
MDIKEWGHNDMDWIHLAQDRLVAGPCGHDHKPLHLINDVKFLEWLRDF